MASILYVDVRKGMVIVGEDGQLYQCVDRELRTPGNLPSKLTLKLKSLKTGFVNQVRVHPEDKVEQAYLEKREMQYLYKDGDDYYFMDTASYDQIHISSEALGDSVSYLKPEMTIQVEFYGSEPVGIELPQTVDLKVLQTVPGIKGATASNQVKPATLETGLVVQVPPFINEGDLIRVSTESGEYLSRV